MKTNSVLGAVLLATAFAPVAPAEPATGSPAPAAPAAVQAPAKESPPVIDVVYVEPEKFTDVKDSFMGTEKGREGYLEMFKDFLVERTGKYLPAGSKLTIKITNIDMAGDFEPWRGPQFNDVRVVKEIYIPAIDLSYTLTDASGAVVQQGEEKLRDMNYQMNTTASFFTSDPLRYEKNMLDTWIRSTFSKGKGEKAKK